MDPFVASAAINAGSSLLGGLFGSSSAKKAAKAQQQAAAAAQQEISRQYDTTRGDLAPWRQAGASALDRLQFLLGTGGSGSVSPAASQAQNALASAEAEYRALVNATPGYTREQITAMIGPRPRAGGEGSDPAERAKWDARAQALGARIDPAGAWSAPGTGGASPEAVAAARQRVEAARNALSGAQAQPYSPGAGYGSLLRPFSESDFFVDPGYQFRQQEGNRAIENSAAARGMQLSGAALKGLSRFNSGLAAQEYGAAFGRDAANKDRAYNYLSGQSAQGLGASSQTGAFGAQAAGSVADLMTQSGNAQAAGIVGSGNAWSNALSGAAGGVSDYLMLKQLLRKG